MLNTALHSKMTFDCVAPDWVMLGSVAAAAIVALSTPTDLAPMVSRLLPALAGGEFGSSANVLAGALGSALGSVRRQRGAGTLASKH